MDVEAQQTVDASGADFVRSHGGASSRENCHPYHSCRLTNCYVSSNGQRESGTAINRIYHGDTSINHLNCANMLVQKASIGWNIVPNHVHHSSAFEAIRVAKLNLRRARWPHAITNYCHLDNDPLHLYRILECQLDVGFPDENAPARSSRNAEHIGAPIL